MERTLRPALRIAQEIRQLTRDFERAPAREQEKLVRQMYSLLAELAAGPAEREAADVILALLKARAFGSMKAASKMSCRALAVDVLSGWGFLELVAPDDREHWSQQRERLAQGRQKTAERVAEGGLHVAAPPETAVNWRRGGFALLLVALAQMPLVVIGFYVEALVSFLSQKSFAPWPSSIFIASVLIACACLAVSLMAIVDPSAANRRFARGVLATEAALFVLVPLGLVRTHYALETVAAAAPLVGAVLLL